MLSFNSAAYLCEIFRAGIQSISRGQMEAARSLGMTTPKAMFYVIIPQTVRRILPTMMSEFILLFKDTALLAAVGIGEMVLQVARGGGDHVQPVALRARGRLLPARSRFRSAASSRRSRTGSPQSEGRGARQGRRSTTDTIDSEHVVSSTSRLRPARRGSHR